MFDRDKQKSVLLTEEEWDRFQSRWHKFCGWFGTFLTPWL